MKNKRAAWLWIGIAVVVIIIIFVVVAVWHHGSNSSQGMVPAYAPAGQLVNGFPTDLVLDQAAKVTSSYSINYSTSTDQYSAVWNSSSSMTALYTQYKTYFSSNGWTLTNDITKYSFSRGLYATNNSADVSVSIIAAGTNNNTSTQITVTYLKK